ncbi:MAG TPA: hypothetical protein DDY91_10205 [Planctomycetaceae bacterium]|nr:hypothetical protein [Planctomycetaceae bacterium]
MIKIVESPGITRVILIDLDNCPGELLRIVSEADESVRVIGCHGPKEPHVGVGLVPRLARLLSEQRLRIQSMAQGGKNAADFGLTFWGGWLAGQLPPETEFVVVSNDTDLDHLVSLLVNSGRSARRVTAATQRVTTLTPAPTPASPPPPTNPRPAAATSAHSAPARPGPAPTQPAKSNSDSPVQTAVDTFIARVSKSKNRPKKLTALKNCLKSYNQTLNPNLIDTIVRHLVQRQVLTISGKTVTYQGG